jgi:hypothetical protein
MSSWRILDIFPFSRRLKRLLILSNLMDNIGITCPHGIYFYLPKH